MTKLAYLECPTGLAGDMCLGALVDAGVPLEYLVEQLQRLGVADEYKLWAEKVLRNGQQATKVHVDLLSPADFPVPVEADVDPHTTFNHTSNLVQATPPHSHTSHSHSHDHSPHRHPHSHSPNPHSTLQHPTPNTQHPPTRHLPEIEHLIHSAQLPKRVEAWSIAIFQRLAAAEGAVHGISPEEVHFHEVGATDAIVDIVGTCLGLDWLGIDELYCSPMPTGGGVIRAAHGQLPVPTPAVLKLWEMRQVPIYHNGIERELVTPTGAAIATTLATQFGPPPPMTLHKVGLGAGSRNLPIPNIVRLWIGEAGAKADDRRQTAESTVAGLSSLQSELLVRTRESSGDEQTAPEAETIAVLETQIDDLNPQAIGYVFEALFVAGAVDVFTQAVGMKKSRPGVLLSVICHLEQKAACEAVLFRETTTLGIRCSIQQRTILNRVIQMVETNYGPVRVKIAQQHANGPVMNVQPEYEDCAAIARQHDIPWKEVHQAALQAWHLQRGAVTVGISSSAVGEKNS
ncbi:MAG TPA: nickel pincer cofactor biosynthesis protein LarC [Crinalium sp.]|jgi:hypothetical protein